MDEHDLNFLRTSFDRIEILLGRIVESLEKKNSQKKLSNVDGGALKIADLWNEYKAVGLMAVKGLSPQSSRHKNASARWREKPTEEYWISVVQRVNVSKFCNGDNERRWFADFEFLVRPDVHYRILEGKYDKCHASFKNEAPKHRAMDVTGLLLEKLPAEDPIDGGLFMSHLTKEER